MNVIRMQCPNCGATFTVNEGGETAVCEYCGAQVAVPRTQTEVRVERREINRKAFLVFGIIAAVLIIAALVVVLSFIGGKSIDPRAYKTAGVYLVGKDIPAGEYVLYPDIDKTDGDVTPVLEVRKTREAATDRAELLYRKEFYMRQYVNLNEGEYIAFDYALMYLPESVKLEPLGNSGYAAAQLKVGVDIPAGEYVIVGKNKQAQYFITSKPEAELYGTAALNSPNMLSFGYCENRVYLKVQNGEYLSFAGGRLYDTADAPAPEKTTEGALPPGQYKVGGDIGVGKYNIFSAENKKSQAWVCLNKNTVVTGRVDSLETDPIASDVETLLFVRMDDVDEPHEIVVPDPGDDEFYITLRYCFAAIRSQTYSR